MIKAQYTSLYNEAVLLNLNESDRSVVNYREDVLNACIDARIKSESRQVQSFFKILRVGMGG